MKQLFSCYLKGKTTFTISFLILLFATTKTNAQWIELGGTHSIFNPNGAFNNVINSVATDVHGNVYAGGGFTDSNGIHYVAKWNGTAWSELGGTNGSPFRKITDGNSITSIATDASGNVYVSGNYTDVNGKGYVAKWDGTAWSELGGANDNPFSDIGTGSIAINAAGNVYVAGHFVDSGYHYEDVAEWNGTTWKVLGGGTSKSTTPFDGAFSLLYSIATDAGGNVYAGGNFVDANGKQYVAKWNGTAWSEVGGANGSIFNNIIESIATDASGNLYAAGKFTDAKGKGYIAKWNGSVWSELDGTNNNSLIGITNFITTDARGNIYAAGGGIYGTNHYVAKWNDTVWSELGETPFNSAILSIAIGTGGNVYTTGAFTDSNGYHYVAEYAQNILPVTLLSFTATKENKDVAIKWQTTNEINTAYFNIQRSTDGRSFANIGKVAAKGSNKVNNNYAYVDDNIAQLHAARLYYRLQEVDNDGKFSYSSIKIVDINTNNVLFTISPNPARDYINISSSGNIANTQVSVTDINGRTLYIAKQNFTANQQIKIPTSQFAKQVLIVTIITDNAKQEFKVVKE